MKRILTTVFIILGILCLSLPAISQVPNAGFENWSNGNPDNWSTSNIPQFVTNVTQSGNSHSGSFAAFLEVIDVGGLGVAPSMFSVDPQAPNAFGFPISQAYQNLTGYYQFTPTGSAIFLVSVTLYHASAQDTAAVAGGAFGTSQAASSYTQFNAPMIYFPGALNPNFALISIQVTDTITGFPPSGASALFDDLAFQGIVGINDGEDQQLIEDFTLHQNYPNPFNPVTTISFNLPGNSEVELFVYDLTGHQIKRLVFGAMPQGLHRVQWDGTNEAGFTVPSGMYFYQLKTKGYQETRRMLLMK